MRGTWEIHLRWAAADTLNPSINPTTNDLVKQLIEQMSGDPGDRLPIHQALRHEYFAAAAADSLNVSSLHRVLLAQDLVSKMTAEDPGERLTIEEALQHNYFMEVVFRGADRGGVTVALPPVAVASPTHRVASSAGYVKPAWFRKSKSAALDNLSS